MNDRCEYHENLACRVAKTEEQTSGHDDWITKIEKRLEENHKATLEAIAELKSDINHAKGAGWMLVKLGAAFMAFVTFAAALARLIGGK